MAKQNLLLVDADTRSVRLLEPSLRKAGFSITACGDADSALALVDLVEPALIIVDTQLPGRDGFELVEALRARESAAHIPLMFLSSDPSVEGKVRGLQLGVEDYLAKPASIREILARVKYVMERSERAGMGGASKTRFAGALEDMGMVDLLQTIDMGHKSGLLRLSSGKHRGSVVFHEGRVMEAELGALHGERAIYRALLWSVGNFELEFRDVPADDRVGISTQALLMEGMRRLDEWARLQEHLSGLDCVLEIRHVELATRLGDIPDEANDVLRVVDGQRDLSEVLDAAGGDDLANLNALGKLFSDGFLAVLNVSTQVENAPPAEPELRVSVANNELAGAGAGRTSLGVVQLKRVLAINDSNGQYPGAVLEVDARLASRPPTPAPEGDEKMKSKRTVEPAQERPDNVIRLRTGERADDPGSSTERRIQDDFEDDGVPLELTQPRLTPDRDDHDDDARAFFSSPPPISVGPNGEAWDDFDHEPAHPPLHRGAMYWAVGIGSAGLLLIGAFLLYSKVLMPTPEDFPDRGPLALPTPDMVQVQPSEPIPDEPEPPAVVEAPAVEASAVEPSVAEPSNEAPASAAPDVAAAPSGDEASLVAEARKLGYRARSEELLLQASQLAPSSSTPLGALAMLYLNQGKNAQAKQRAEQAIALNANNDEAWIVLGAAEETLGRAKAARAAYMRCASLPSGKHVAECKRLVH